MRVCRFRGAGGVRWVGLTILCMGALGMGHAWEDIQIDLMAKDNPMGMRMVEQTFTVTYASPEDATKAQIAPTPVYGGKQWAFTSRWDDNRAGCTRMEALLSKYGFGGTFYLNSKGRGDAKYAERYGPKWATSLIQNKCTVGGHTLSHPMLPKLTLNEIFYEIAAIKIEREADTNDPINALAFPYGRHRNEDLRSDPTPHMAIAQSLARMGYVHVTYPSLIDKKVGVAPEAFSCQWRLQPGDQLSPPDVFDKQLAGLLSNEWRNKVHPCISLGVHVGHNDQGFANLETSLKKHQGRPEFWYTNETRYGAYRYLAKHCKIEKASQDGATVTYRLTRPASADIGEQIPLTLAITQARVASASAPADKPASEEGRTLIDIAPPSDEPFPAKIDWVPNPDNASKPAEGLSAGEFPGLLFFLRYDESAGKLYLRCDNRSDKAANGAFVSFSLPLAYDTGICRRKIGDLAPGKSAILELKLPEMREDPLYREGRPFFVAKVEFQTNGETGWIYATTHAQADSEPQPNVRDAALVAGPIAKDKVDLQALAPFSKPGAPLGKSTPAGDWVRPWHRATGTRTNGEYVDLGSAPDLWYRRARGFMSQHGGYYAVALDFESNGATSADIVVARPEKGEPAGMLLNGNVVSDMKKLTGIQPGRNRLIALLAPRQRQKPALDQRNFIRITPDQGSITYVLPKKSAN